MRKFALIVAAVAATATVSTAAAADVIGSDDGDGLSPGSPCYDAESFDGGGWEEWHDRMAGWMGHDGAMPMRNDAGGSDCIGDHDQWHDWMRDVGDGQMHDDVEGHMHNNGEGHMHDDLDGYNGGCHGTDTAAA